MLVFAAIVAIMLYREMPVAAFEAQRQKEQLLISRGNEYKHAVKLFVRKIGRFPVSVEELENTNRMRFLRHRYVDPLTGKDDWRMIHAGAGGVILDSKVNTTTNSKDPNALGQGAVFAGFNNSFNGDQTAAASESGPPSAATRQRPPATKNAANGTDQFGLTLPAGDSTDPNNNTLGNPGAPANTASNQYLGGQQSTGQPGALDPATGQPIQNLNGAPNGQPLGNGITTMQQQLNNVNPLTPQTGPQQNTGGTGFGSGSFGNTSSFGNSANTSSNAAGTNAAGGPTSNGNGQITAAGGIAGVASNAPGNSIRTVNGQTKYKLWEFYYDMRKEQNAGAPGLGTGQPQTGQQNTNGSSTSAFGQTGFGSSTPQQTTQPPQPQPQ